VQSVQVYIVSIAVSTHPDTGTSADSMHWVTVAAPHRQVDLLTLQQGLTDSLGIGEVTADQYKRCSSRSTSTPRRAYASRNGSSAVVRWNGSGQESYAVFVQAPISVPDTGAVIVIDFDVGRSFVYNQLGDGAFDFFAAIRAVNRAATGNISGTVTHDTSADLLARSRTRRSAPGVVDRATGTSSRPARRMRRGTIASRISCPVLTSWVCRPRPEVTSGRRSTRMSPSMPVPRPLTT